MSGTDVEVFLGKCSLGHSSRDVSKILGSVGVQTREIAHPHGTETIIKQPVLFIFPQAGPDIKFLLGFIRTQLSTSVTVGLVFGPKASTISLSLFLPPFMCVLLSFRFPSPPLSFCAEDLDPDIDDLGNIHSFPRTIIGYHCTCAPPRKCAIFNILVEGT
ncbi:unnamed protein product [Timema podura]|uniref:Uncharacterized protein n=1 Tax=Timema podura TaxID=61482 RepID=A0ABN7P3H8_TIMPD|nr:unnamed protein product [Timema podura]